MKITSTIALDLDKDLVGADIIAFAAELEMRKAAQDKIEVEVHKNIPDRGGMETFDVTISHESHVRPSTPNPGAM